MAITCHTHTTLDRSVLLFGEGNSPTLPPPFSFHSRSRGRRRHSSGRGCPAIMVRALKTPSKYNAKTGTLPCKYKANTGSQKTLPYAALLRPSSRLLLRTAEDINEGWLYV